MPSRFCRKRPCLPFSMSDSDFSGRLLAPVMARPRRPLSNSASTASCSMRFSLRTMMSGRAQLDQPLQAVVAVDDAAVQVVQVGGGEAAAIQRHQRAQLGRDHRHDVEDHPVRPRAASANASISFSRLTSFLRLASEVVSFSSARSRTFSSSESMPVQHLLDRLGADADARTASSPNSSCLASSWSSVSSWCSFRSVGAGLQHDVALEVEDLLQLLQRQVDHQADPAGQRLQEPDMRDRARPARYGPCARAGPWPA